MNALTKRVVNAETSIKQNSEAIELSATKTEVTKAADATLKSAKTYADAQIKVAADSINQNVTKKFDGLQIGGRNLLLNSADLTKWDQSVGPAIPDSDGYFKVTYDGPSIWWGTRQKVTLKVGQTYTLSGWCKGNAARLYAYANETDQYCTEANTTSTGKFLSITFTPKQATSFYIICYAKKGIINYYKLPKLERGNKATDWTPAPEDYLTSDETTGKLTELRQEVNSNIEQTGEAIKSSVYEKVYMKDDVDTLLSLVNTEVEQTKTSWQVTFNQLVKQLNDYSDGSDAAFDEIRKYIRFEDGNILLGNSSSPLILRIRNDRIQFLQNGYEVAYISDQRMYNTTCEIINQLRIADSAWTVETNSNGDTIVSLIGL